MRGLEKRTMKPMLKINLISCGNIPVQYDLIRSRGQQHFFPVPSLKGSSDAVSCRSDDLEKYSIHALKFLLILVFYESLHVYSFLKISLFLRCLLSFDYILDARLGSGDTVVSFWRALWSPYLGKEVRSGPGNYKCAN